MDSVITAYPGPGNRLVPAIELESLACIPHKEIGALYAIESYLLGLD